LAGSFLFTREFLRQLRSWAQTLSDEQKAQAHASIAIIGSTAGIFGEAMHADYAASKSALHTGFLRSLKNEIVLIVPRATANVIAPGWVNTKMAQVSIAAGKHLKALKTMPLKKLATTEDVATAVMTALSPTTGGHMTGQVIELAGGMEGRVLWPDL
jgi:NAD(P)-dependent dehydrogenase (short-subunit alcohol dehydrogenase family)